MKIEDLWKEYQEQTKEVTEASRKLAMAGAAICWFFKTPEVTFPAPVLVSLIFIVSFFALDLSQFFSTALLYRFWIRHEEKLLQKSGRGLDEGVKKAAWLNYPGIFFFVTKVICLLIGFLALSVEFILRIFT